MLPQANHDMSGENPLAIALLTQQAMLPVQWTSPVPLDVSLPQHLDLVLLRLRPLASGRKRHDAEHAGERLLTLDIPLEMIL